MGGLNEGDTVRLARDATLDLLLGEGFSPKIPPTMSINLGREVAITAETSRSWNASPFALWGSVTNRLLHGNNAADRNRVPAAAMRSIAMSCISQRERGNDQRRIHGSVQESVERDRRRI